MPYPLKTGIGLGLGLRNTGFAMGSNTSRYFRRNLGTIDYYSHTAVTVDRIVMDVEPVSGGSGLPTGAPPVTDNVLQTIDFAYTGSISELCRNGTSYFSGVMANVKYYFNGEQIHGYKIESDSNDIPDTVGSNNATVINGLASDWGLFTEQGDGNWLGQELIVNGGFDVDLIGWVIGGTPDSTHNIIWDNGTALYTCGVISPSVSLRQLNVTTIGVKYRLTLDNSITLGQMKTTSFGTHNLIDGYNTVDGVATTALLEITRAVADTESNIDNVSVKEVLIVV